MRTKNTNGELFDYIPLTSPNLIGDTMATPRGLLYRKHSCFTTVFMDSSYLHANIASLIQLPSHRTLTEPQHFGFFADFIGTPTTPKNCHYTWCLPRKKRLNQFVKVCFSTLSNYIQYPAPSFSKKKGLYHDKVSYPLWSRSPSTVPIPASWGIWFHKHPAGKVWASGLE